MPNENIYSNLSNLSDKGKHRPESLDAGKYDLSFTVKSRKENFNNYVFKNVVIAIDTSGKHYEKLPELMFGTYDGELNEQIDGEMLMNQPESKRENVDMEYVAACIAEVVKATGMHEFWFAPYGKDSPNDREGRKQARVRLYSKYFDIVPAGDERKGYIVKI